MLRMIIFGVGFLFSGLIVATNSPIPLNKSLDIPHIIEQKRGVGSFDAEINVKSSSDIPNEVVIRANHDGAAPMIDVATEVEEKAIENDDAIGKFLDSKSGMESLYAEQHDSLQEHQKLANENFDLKPRMREEKVEEHKYKLDLTEMNTYLSKVIVVDAKKNKKKKDNYRKITAINFNANLGFHGATIYGSGLEKDSAEIYSMLKEGLSYCNPETSEYLGKIYRIVGEAKIIERSSNSALRVESAVLPVEKGDKLIEQVNVAFPRTIYSRFPEIPFRGYIVGTVNNRRDIGKYSNVVVSLGHRDGVKVGDLLAVRRSSIRKMYDKKLDKRFFKNAKNARTTHVGDVVVYQVFDKLSLGFVVAASSVIFIDDFVTS